MYDLKNEHLRASGANLSFSPKRPLELGPNSLAGQLWVLSTGGNSCPERLSRKARCYSLIQILNSVYRVLLVVCNRLQEFWPNPTNRLRHSLRKVHPPEADLGRSKFKRHTSLAVMRRLHGHHFAPCLLLAVYIYQYQSLPNRDFWAHHQHPSMLAYGECPRLSSKLPMTVPLFMNNQVHTQLYSCRATTLDASGMHCSHSGAYLRIRMHWPGFLNLCLLSRIPIRGELVLLPLVDQC